MNPMRKNALRPALWAALLFTVATAAHATTASPKNSVGFEAGSQPICQAQAGGSVTTQAADPRETAAAFTYCCAPSEGIYCRQISTLTCTSYGGAPITTLSSCRRFCPL